MKRLVAHAAVLSLVTGAAAAAELTPTGDWRVKEGYANIRIDNCGGKMWGIVAWEKEPGFDTENPDPSKKGRPILGMPILLGMAPTGPNKWEGEIYNSQDGRTYSANISMLDENTLKLQGCVLGGWFCGGENWTRVTAPPTGGAGLPAVALPKAAQPTKGGQKATPPQSDVCTRIASVAAVPGTAKK